MLRPPAGVVSRLLTYAAVAIVPVLAGLALVQYGERTFFRAFFLLGATTLGLLLPAEFLFGLTMLGLIGGSSLLWADEFVYVRFFFLGLFLAKALPDLALRRIRLARFPTPFLLPLGVFAGVALASTLYSGDPETTLQRAVTWCLMLLALGIYLWAYVDSWQRAERVVGALVAVTVAVVLASTAAALLGIVQVEITSGFRGLLGNPNGMGGLLMLTTLPLYWQYQRSRRPAYALILGLFVIILYLTTARGAILAVAVSFYLYFRFTGRIRLLRSLATVTALFLLAVTIWSGLLSREIAVGGRLEAWPLAVALIAQRPVLGYGFGTVEGVFVPVLEEARLQIFSGANPHNSYLNVLLESGLVGFVLLVWPLILAAALGVKLVRSHPQNDFLAMVVAVAIGGMVHGFFETWMTSVGSMLALPFWLYVMLIFRAQTLEPSAT